MGIGVPRALLATLLIAGVFFAPLTPLAYADEASTTPDGAPSADQSASTTPLTATSTTDSSSSASITANTATSTPLLPTGVLLDRSLADQDWDISVRGGHYTYFINGYEALGNPPTLASASAWITTGTTTTARVQVSGDTSCDQLTYSATSGLGVFDPTYIAYYINQYATRAAGEHFCDFHFQGEGIPPGTSISGIYLGTSGAASLVGSAANHGLSLNGSNQDPVPGGFAFQLCGVDGCSGGFASSTVATTTPRDTATTTPKISNVLFFPGIEQSKLYKLNPGCTFPTDNCVTQEWSPINGHTEPYELLDDSRQGLSTKIYTKAGEIVSSAGLLNFYTAFFHDLDDTVGKDHWVPIAYDWRLSLDDVLNNGTQHGDYISYSEASSSPYIEQTLRNLASSSPTGKVTIVAHSNGGLVAKALLRKLGDTESSKLIDKVILVAVPQSGAPQSIGGLLYGYGSALPFDRCANWFTIINVCGAIVSRPEVRSMALSSPMAYHLLPSQAYIDSVNDPNHSLFSFTGTHAFQSEMNAYGNTIDSWQELSDFLSAKEGGRPTPFPDDTDSPGVASSTLLSYAQTIHSSLDTWTPPTSISVYQIAGWGDMTVSGISWYEELQTTSPYPVYKKQYRPIFVRDGDKVVPIPSALEIPASQNVKNLWVNFVQEATNHFRFPKLGHGEILEVKELRDVISNILNGNPGLSNSVVLESNPKSPTDLKKLIFILHSPLSIQVQDSTGRITGDGSDGNSVQSLIPDSDFGYLGEIRYVAVPANDKYRLILQGRGSGTFSLDVYEEENEQTGPITTFASIPVQANTRASIEVNGVTGGIGDLQIDVDGNNSYDLSIVPHLGQSLTYEYIPTPKTHSSRSTTRNEETLPATLTIKEIVPTTVVSSYKKRDIEKEQPNTLIVAASTTDLALSVRNEELTASVYNALDLEQLRTFFLNLIKSIAVFLSRLFVTHLAI